MAFWGSSGKEKWQSLNGLFEGMADAAFMLNLEGKIVAILKNNPTRHPIPEIVVGHYLRELLGPEQGLKGSQAMRDALTHNRRQSFDYSIKKDQNSFYFHAELIPLPKELRGREDRVLWLAYDQTEKKTAEAGLWMKNELLEGILASRIALMGNEKTPGNDVIAESLHIVGEATKADRVYILEHYQTPYYQVLSLQHEWCRHGVPSQFGNPRMEQIDYEDLMPGWLKSLLKSGYKYFDVEELPENMREVVRVAQEQWLLLLPIFKEKVLWGVLGIEFHRPHRPWSEEEIRILQAATGTISGYIVSEESKKDLRLAKIEADKANLAKSEFLAVISHELRTPMNAILGYAQLLGQSVKESEQREQLSFIEKSGRSLLELINNILDFSKIESKGVDLEIIPFNFEQVVLETMEVCKIKAKDKGLTLDYEIDKALPLELLGDPYRIKQVLLNLVSNAVKFTTKGGVSVRVTHKEVPETGKSLVYCAVKDSGIGIPPEKASRLFRAFSQADSSTTRQFGGTGLGLAIAKRLVERMNGKIWVESAVGEGSVFNFTLQLERGAIVRENLRRDLSAHAGPSPLPTNINATAQIQHPDGQRASVITPVSPSDSSSELDPTFATRFPLKILLVEDDPMNQKLACKILSRLGYNSVTVAFDGVEGLKRLGDGEYNLVLTDLQMPRMDGISMTRRIRMGECGGVKKNIPIVAITAYAMSEDKERCLDAGMTGFIRKPIQVADLKESLVVAYHQALKRKM